MRTNKAKEATVHARASLPFFFAVRAVAFAISAVSLPDSGDEEENGLLYLETPLPSGSRSHSLALRLYVASNTGSNDMADLAKHVLSTRKGQLLLIACVGVTEGDMEKVRPEDLLFPQAAYSYDPGMPRQHADVTMLELAMSIASRPPLHALFTVHFGSILSGASGVDHPVLSSVGLWALGHETDCYGFYRACSNKKLPHFFVKGAVDTKSRTTEVHQERATMKASLFALHLIQRYMALDIGFDPPHHFLPFNVGFLPQEQRR